MNFSEYERPRSLLCAPVFPRILFCQIADVHSKDSSWGFVRQRESAVCSRIGWNTNSVSDTDVGLISSAEKPLCLTPDVLTADGHRSSDRRFMSEERWREQTHEDDDRKHRDDPQKTLSPSFRTIMSSMGRLNAPSTAHQYIPASSALRSRKVTVKRLSSVSFFTEIFGLLTWASSDRMICWASLVKHSPLQRRLISVEWFSS